MIGGLIPPPRELFQRAAQSPSAIVLIVTNLIPVFGVFFLDWNVGYILALYWLENVAVGVINVLKIVTAAGEGKGHQESKLFIAPFFTVHYGIFTLVHGVFVFAMFQGDSFGAGGSPLAAARELLPSLLLPALCLFASHLYSYLRNFIGGGEFRKMTPAMLMAAPYGRVVILHVTILFGGFVTMALGNPKPIILLLVFLKIVTDLAFHLHAHGKQASE